MGQIFQKKIIEALTNRVQEVEVSYHCISYLIRTK